MNRGAKICFAITLAIVVAYNGWRYTEKAECEKAGLKYAMVYGTGYRCVEVKP